MIRRSAFGLWVLWWSANAFSAESDVPPAIRACMSIGLNSERLACFDRAVKAVVENGPAAAEPGRSREEVFGIPGQRTPAPAAREAPAAGTADAQSRELDSISSTVKTLKTLSDGRMLIELENGQVWRDEEERRLLLKPGDTVKIVRGSLKSFRMITPSQRIARVTRVH
jgi:hypothetical protein